MVRTEDEFVSEILRQEKVLRAYLHRFAPQPADLEDLLQETYAHLFRLSPERRMEIRNIQAFAITSARNVALSGLRHREVVPMDSIEDLDAIPVDEDHAQLDEIVHSHQQLVRVAEGLASLPARCREIFTLRRVYGFSQKEIAKRLGISEGVVEQQLVKGMRRCAEVLQESASKPLNLVPRRAGWVPHWLRRKESKHGQ
jgi:RNA polymerase sigma-70 factor (ECF subfamily)